MHIEKQVLAVDHSHTYIFWIINRSTLVSAILMSSLFHKIFFHLILGHVFLENLSATSKAPFTAAS